MIELSSNIYNPVCIDEKWLLSLNHQHECWGTNEQGVQDECCRVSATEWLIAAMWTIQHECCSCQSTIAWGSKNVLQVLVLSLKWLLSCCSWSAVFTLVHSLVIDVLEKDLWGFYSKGKRIQQALSNATVGLQLNNTVITEIPENRLAWCDDSNCIEVNWAEKKICFQLILNAKIWV